MYVSESFSNIVMEEMMTGARRVLSWSSRAGSCKRGRKPCSSVPDTGDKEMDRAGLATKGVHSFRSAGEGVTVLTRGSRKTLPPNLGAVRKAGKGWPPLRAVEALEVEGSAKGGGHVSTVQCVGV